MDIKAIVDFLNPNPVKITKDQLSLIDDTRKKYNKSKGYHENEPVSLEDLEKFIKGDE